MYSIVLAGFYVIVREYFYAGLIINLLSASAFLITGYYLVQNVFNRATAVFFVLAATATFTFQDYTVQAGSDMLFLAFCSLSLFFLFRNETRGSLVLSAMFALLAFLTRYNGAFLIPGAFAFFLLAKQPFTFRLKRLGLWLAVFLVAGMPWFYANWQATGNPVKNDNFQNIAIEYYSIDRTDTYDQWESLIPPGIHSTLDIILYDPVYFFQHTLLNVARHFLADISTLIGIPLGLLVPISLIMLHWAKPDRRKLLFWAFGVFCFLILVLVFYNERFSLPLLLFYFPLAAWPFTALKRIPTRIGSLGTALALILIAWLCATSTYTSYKTVSVKQSAEELKSLGLDLSTQVFDPHDKIAARVPHIAHYAGLTPHMFPADLATLDDLISFCRTYNIKYIAYTFTEYQDRPSLRVLWDKQFPHPSLTRVAANRAGVIFRVEQP